MIYKRGIHNLDKFKNTEYILSNNSGVYMNTSVIGSNFAPYHGLFIKQQAGCIDQILLAKLTEEIDFGTDGKIEIKDYKTSEATFGGCEYLVSFENTPVPTYVYEINGCTIEKKYKFCKGSNILCVDYVITNSTPKLFKFSVMPNLTKRGLFEIKRASDMKYVATNTNNMVKVTLSVMEATNIYLKSTSMKYIKDEHFIKGINYDFEEMPGKIKTYVEDLFVPGRFEAVIKGGHSATLTIYISLKDIEGLKLNTYDIEQDNIAILNSRIKTIDDSYVELKLLAQSSYLLHFIDEERRKMVLLESIPVIPEGDEYVKNIIASIEGNYLILKRFKEAYKILESMKCRLEDDTYVLNAKDRCEAELLFIEAVNRYLQESECRSIEIKQFYEYIKRTINKYIEHKNEDAFMDKDFLLNVKGKKYIKINALWYNALRILMFLQDKFYENSEYIYSISENVRSNIVTKFWVPEKNILKYEINDDIYTNFNMIYTLSLSYPALHETIAMKLIDTAFKELYTPLGMRKYALGTDKYDGFVYPHLMVHFLKANLRQMGVTRATQKLGYNLVKDLFAEINKDVIGTVKYKYYEKTKKGYGFPVNAITNAELIRMFDMLT